MLIWSLKFRVNEIIWCLRICFNLTISNYSLLKITIYNLLNHTEKPCTELCGISFSQKFIFCLKISDGQLIILGFSKTRCDYLGGLRELLDISTHIPKVKNSPSLWVLVRCFVSLFSSLLNVSLLIPCKVFSDFGKLFQTNGSVYGVMEFKFYFFKNKLTKSILQQYLVHSYITV